MSSADRFVSKIRRANTPRAGLFPRVARHGWLLLALGAAQAVLASENVPELPFAEWADVPAPGQFILGAVYEQSKSYNIYAKDQVYGIKVRAGGENYGIDIRQGFFALQYGITERWAADLEVGGTTVGWRAFDPGNQVESTIGVMDTSLGVRYQIFNEAQCTDSPWIPTLTFRAGAVLPGTYDQNIAYAPGFRSAAIQPQLLARKHFGWPGLGGYFDGYYRWNMTTENDNYSVAVGFFQQIRGWELDAGYMHMQTTSGGDIAFAVPGDITSIIYPRDVREIFDSIQAGFSYTTSKRHWKYGFHANIYVDGNNSDNKPWFGGSIEIPIDLIKR
jgi:hypothetical protein